MRRVIIESPFAHPTAEGRAANREYAKRCLADSLQRGEAPFAGHLLYPQVLDDDVPVERSLGIEAGLTWGALADATVVYMDRGHSRGMTLGITRAKELGRPVEYRWLDRIGDVSEAALIKSLGE